MNAAAWSKALETTFKATGAALFGELAGDEFLSLYLTAESSQFVRFNNARVRQIGTVEDASLVVRFVKGTKQVILDRPFTGDGRVDLAALREALVLARADAAAQPDDPAIVRPDSSARSHSEAWGVIPDPELAAERLLRPAEGTDMCGLYAGGPVVRALADSTGQEHWFATENFFVDYSLWHPTGKAVKSGYAGARFDEAEWARSLGDARAQLAALDNPMLSLDPGTYRAFLEPGAMSEILGMFSWHGLSERALRHKESAFLPMREGRETLSPHITLRETFRSGLVPRFTSEGSLAPEESVLIDKGALRETLVSPRTGKEYGIAHNGANTWESLRSPELDAGSLPRARMLEALGTGLYLPNLHYLNWSDVQAGRITGMTRYAALWVENGKYKGPIKDLRFDDTVYTVLGKELEALTSERLYVPETGTYGSRSLGGALLPGALVKNFRFTL